MVMGLKDFNSASPKIQRKTGGITPIPSFVNQVSCLTMNSTIFQGDTISRISDDNYLNSQETDKVRINEVLRRVSDLEQGRIPVRKNKMSTRITVISNRLAITIVRKRDRNVSSIFVMNGVCMRVENRRLENSPRNVEEVSINLVNPLIGIVLDSLGGKTKEVRSRIVIVTKKKNGRTTEV